MLNPPLILVSALFFLALVSGLYLAAWLLCGTVLRLAGRGLRVSHAGAKRLLMAGLLLPPLIALVPTVNGATLRHVHAAVTGGHHSSVCRVVFARFLEPGGLGAGEPGRLLARLLVNGLAWSLVAVGVFLLLRLLVATVRLERGLVPFLAPPSPKLSASLARLAPRLPGLPTGRFFECPVPAAYSSVLGVFRARCVLSRALVAQATEAEIDAIVAHEATHLRSGDILWTTLVGCLNWVFFYRRPVRLLARRGREEAELACDAAAVSVTGEPLAMASAILRATGVPTQHGVGRSLPAVALPFADEAACAPSRRIEPLLARADRVSWVDTGDSPLRAAGGWLVTFALAGTGSLVLLSPEAACYAHCSLESIAHLLR